MVDTGIVTTYAVELLKKSFEKVYPVNGVAVAFARKAWGLPPKSRMDHRHHAVDAMVIAALDQKRFNDICSALKNEDKLRTNRRISDICPPPFEGVDYVKSIEKAKDEICVRNLPKGSPIRQSKRKVLLANASGNNSGKKVVAGGSIVRNSLHDATVYGCIRKPGSNENIYVIRRPLIGAKISDIKVDDIVDDKIREIVINAIARLSKEGKNTFSEGDIKMSSGVVINKVRMKTKVTMPLKLKEHKMKSKLDYKKSYYVSNDTIFRAAVLETESGQRTIEHDYLFNYVSKNKDEKKGKLLGFIKPGFLAMTPNGFLYRIVNFETLKTPNGVILRYITFIYHTEARKKTELQNYLSTPGIGRHKTGEADFSTTTPYEMLHLSKDKYLQMLYENVDFKMSLDGEIEYINVQK